MEYLINIRNWGFQINRFVHAILIVFFATSTNAQYEISGYIIDSNGEAISNARVTLFNEDEYLFFEVRTTDIGYYNLVLIPEGDYTLGATALKKEYETIGLDVSEDLVDVNFSLEEEFETGNWTIIMDSPEPLGGTDFGILLPDGRIYYCHNTEDPFLFDPIINDTAFIQGDDELQGCVAPALTTEGDLIIVGGTDQEIYGPGTQLVKTFNPETGIWEDRAGLIDYRWYPTMTQLADGNYLVIGGGGSDNPERVKTSEIYNPYSFVTRQVDDIEVGNEVSPIVLLYDGRALMTHRPPQLFNPLEEQWELAADFIQGDRLPNGDHSDHELVLLPDGRVVAIGYKSFDPPNYGNIVEIYSPEANEWTLGQNQLPVRSRAKTVLLPNKEILVMGGEKEDPNDPTPTNQWNYMSITDVYNPYSNSWRRLESLNIAREYHCNTILVPDGRIIAAGGEGSPGNEPNKSVIEAFEPPYLFKGIRPEIHNINKQEFSRGESIEFDIEKTNSPTSIILISLQSVTHFMNTGNNRFLELDFSQNGNRINATLPIDSLDAMPGYYMLFAMVDDIPSVAEIIKVNKEEVVTSVAKIENENDVKIYPNPSLDKVFVKMYGLDEVIIEVYNSSGQCLESRKKSSDIEMINIEHYIPGNYWIKIKIEEQVINYELIKI